MHCKGLRGAGIAGVKSSQSRVESAKLGPGIRASPRKEILFPNFRGAAAQDQESSSAMTRIAIHFTTREVRRLGALRIFFRENKAFEKIGAVAARRYGAASPYCDSRL